MVEVKIDHDEWYPVYFICDYGDKAELTDEEKARVTAAFDEFDAVQDILRAAICRRHGHLWREYGLATPEPVEACGRCGKHRDGDSE